MSATATNKTHPQTHPESLLIEPLPARIARAQSLVKEGRFKEAEQAWQAMLTDHPDTLPAVNALITLREGRGDSEGARELLRAFIARQASLSTPASAAAARHFERWENNPLPADIARGRTLRLALVGTGTLAPLASHLRVAAGTIGLHPVVHVGEFNQWMQELLIPDSSVYPFAPEVIALCLDVQTLFPLISTTPGDDESTAEARASEAEYGLSQIKTALNAAARYAPRAVVILHTFAVPDYSPLGIRDTGAGNQSQRAQIENLNRALGEMARERAASPEGQRVFLLDQERVEARFGKALVRDDRMWYLASLPFSEAFLPSLAAAYTRILRPLKGLTRKCIVLDLDNTLWGGVVGEDGADNLKLGGTAAPGNAFYDFQRELDSLSRRGILLALCSKNNETDVWPVLESHPLMLLRRDRFAAVRVNWDDKAANIAAIARELNIGLDSLVFLDDNPAERAQVRQRLPEVLTPELPRDPAGYPALLRSLDVFETLTLTDEDRARAKMYQEQAERKAFEAKVAGVRSDSHDANASGGDLAAYLSDLQMSVTLAREVTPFTLPRIAQLINKTNQFNLTTRRYTEAEVQAMAADPAHWGIYSVSVSDRFGDSGLTGVALVEKEPDTWRLDTFLLSCRVMSRGVEDAMFCAIREDAQAAKATRLRAAFLPTEKNAPAAPFLPRIGFSPISPTDFELSLENAEPVVYPAWLNIVRAESTKRNSTH